MHSQLNEQLLYIMLDEIIFRSIIMGNNEYVYIGQEKEKTLVGILSLTAKSQNPCLFRENSLLCECLLEGKPPHCIREG